MAYSSLKQVVLDLEQNNHLVRISQEVDPHLQMAEIQRQVYQAGGKAILFENVKGSPFPALANLYGTIERCRFLFRDSLSGVQSLIKAKGQNPVDLLKKPMGWFPLLNTLLKSPPKRVSKPSHFQEVQIEDIPQIVSWPKDGGAFITLPQVVSQDPENPGWMNSNTGMYRVQLSGNDYLANQEIGMHYQIHRGIGIHHAKALAKGQDLKVAIYVGGPPAHTFAAVMPLPEKLPEMAFAGALANRRFRYFEEDGWLVSAEADFCILGTISAETKPEGPFGDHLGYYSLTHEMPLMKVHKVYASKDAIYPFTVVGRPPQEDTSFGNLIHEITGDAVSVEIPGVKSIHAVDEAGVHPLLLAIGSERYVPYEDRYPMEILTQSNAILGFGQCSLAKYLTIVAREDNENLDINDLEAYWIHLLERIDWRRDVHFQTSTTMDTLDYSGTGLNQGSKVVFAAAGNAKRTLAKELQANFPFALYPVIDGVFAIQTPSFLSEEATDLWVKEQLDPLIWPEGVAMLVLSEEAQFVAASCSNWLWATFTRSNPSHDIYGIHSSIEHKHWGCKGPLVIDARIKPHHAPRLIEDEAICKSSESFVEQILR